MFKRKIQPETTGAPVAREPAPVVQTTGKASDFFPGLGGRLREERGDYVNAGEYLCEVVSHKLIVSEAPDSFGVRKLIATSKVIEVKAAYPVEVDPASGRVLFQASNKVGDMLAFVFWSSKVYDMESFAEYEFAVASGLYEGVTRETFTDAFARSFMDELFSETGAPDPAAGVRFTVKGVKKYKPAKEGKAPGYYVNKYFGVAR